MNNWPYAQKVVEMSAVGGPDAYDALLLSKGYENGFADGYASGSDDRASEDALAFGIAGIALALAGAAGVLITNLVHRRREKKQQDKIERLEEELRDRRSLAVKNSISIRFEIPTMKCLPAPAA